MVLLSSSRQNGSGKKSGCFGNENDCETGAAQQLFLDRQATERTPKLQSPAKKHAKQDKENQTKENPQPVPQHQRHQDENNKTQRNQIPETKAP